MTRPAWGGSGGDGNPPIRMGRAREGMGFPSRFISIILSRSDSNKTKATGNACRFCFGAANEARTRYLHLGKVALYQMSYGRITMQNAL